jgi:hypothetical protein
VDGDGFLLLHDTTVTVVLSLDIDGVPGRLLPQHLENTRLLFVLPYISMLSGVGLLATVYGIDIGERNGCTWSVFGFVSAPCFVGAVLGIGAWARWKRRELSDELSRAHPQYDTQQPQANERTGLPTAITVTDLEVGDSFSPEDDLTGAAGMEGAAAQRRDAECVLKFGRSWSTPYTDRIPSRDWIKKQEAARAAAAVAAAYAP